MINSLKAILKGRITNKPKSSRIEKIKKSLFKVELNWNPIVLYRDVEKDLITRLNKTKSQENTSQDKRKRPRPIYGNIKGSNYDLFENNITLLEDFKKDLIKILRNFFESQIYITESFFNIIQPIDGIGGGNHIHNHLHKVDKIPSLDIAEQKLSLVYYLSIGDQDTQDKGILKFHNPNKDFLPEEGMIVIFPASRLHSVSYNGSKDRVVLVVNFYII